MSFELVGTLSADAPMTRMAAMQGWVFESVPKVGCGLVFFVTLISNFWGAGQSVPSGKAVFL